MKKTTLCYIEKNGEYLMLYRNKKKKDLNKGKWLGVGGHIEDGENIEQCLLREVYEETGLKLLSYRLRGHIIFHIDDLREECFVYSSDSFTGTLKECDEGELKWIAKSEVLSLKLWEGDYLFMDYLLNDKDYFDMTLTYVNDKLINSEVRK